MLEWVGLGLCVVVVALMIWLRVKVSKMLRVMERERPVVECDDDCEF